MFTNKYKIKIKKVLIKHCPLLMSHSRRNYGFTLERVTQKPFYTMKAGQRRDMAKAVDSLMNHIGVRHYSLGEQKPVPK